MLTISFIIYRLYIANIDKIMEKGRIKAFDVLILFFHVWNRIQLLKIYYNLVNKITNNI